MILSRRSALSGGTAFACLTPTARAAKPTTLKNWLERWLAAFNDPRPSTYPNFVKAVIPSLIPYLDEDLSTREASGGFDLVRCEQTAVSEITAWVRDRNWDRFSKVVLSIGDKAIDDVSFSGASAPAGFAIRRTSESQALSTLRNKLRTEASAGRFSGTILVAKQGNVLLRKSYGALDAAGVRAVTPDTRLCIGSMGKMFTAVAILQLVQANRLQLSDSIAKLLLHYPDTPLARSVTVDHLLTHTGGTGDSSVRTMIVMPPNFKRPRISSAYLADVTLCSRPAPVGATAIWASFCSAQSWNRFPAKHGTAIYCAMSFRLPAWLQRPRSRLPTIRRCR